MTEVTIRTENGIVIAAPAFPAECSYVRLLTADGDELVYWDSQEWQDDPTEVMGAFLASLCIGAGRVAEILKLKPPVHAEYKVIMHEHRDPESDEPLFWSNCDGWVSLEAATLFEKDECVNLPREAWGFVNVGKRQVPECSACRKAKWQ